MSRHLNAIFFGLILLLCSASPGGAATTEVLIDGFEDTNYNVVNAVPGDSVTLQKLSALSQGTSSLRLRYSYQPGAAWTKSVSIEKVLSSPVDISGVGKVIRFDVSNFWFVNTEVLQRDEPLTLNLVLIDTAGNESRVVIPEVFKWGSIIKTFAFSTGEFTKSQLATGGRAFNLKEIERVAFRIQNHSDISAPGVVNPSFDNLCVVSNPDLSETKTADNFNAYSDTSALQSVWQPESPASSLGLGPDDSGGSALQMSADITGPSLTYWVARNLSVEIDLRNMTHMRVRMKGDSRLASFNPSAKIFLEDVSGNRALAYIDNWGGVDRWSDNHLPLQNDGIEPLVGGGVGAFGGASCWRQDLNDAGGQAGNINLQRVTRIGLGIGTRNAGAYPLTGINLVFDDVLFGFSPHMETPQNLALALETASAGAPIPLGFSSTDFGTDRFLNQGPTRLNDVPGTLIYSSDPQRPFYEWGLYYTPVPAGVVRTYLHHASQLQQEAKIAATLRNPGENIAHISFQRRSVPPASADYLLVAREGVRRYYENVSMPVPLTLAPGEIALLDPELEDRGAYAGQLLHAIHEFTTDQPLEFKSQMVEKSANSLTVYTVFYNTDTQHREGTFAMLGRENLVPLVYDTASGIGRVRIADWGSEVDPFFEGMDATTDKNRRLWGNYGGTYKVRLNLTASDGRSVAVVQAPSRHSKGYAAYVRWEAPDTGGAGVEQFAPATGMVGPRQGAVVCKLSPGNNPLTLRMDTIPTAPIPDGSLPEPVDFLLIPYGTTAGVAGWEMY